MRDHFLGLKLQAAGSLYRKLGFAVTKRPGLYEPAQHRLAYVKDFSQQQQMEAARPGLLRGLLQAATELLNDPWGLPGFP
jgi:hypothetical protein